YVKPPSTWGASNCDGHYKESPKVYKYRFYLYIDGYDITAYMQKVNRVVNPVYNFLRSLIIIGANL
ncbi:hypothetical protein, partial [Anabaena sp. PCC 7938]|uniref:hypothetical protein n=1 Tax=Anabaena sp. PCC 7938 TaxID=1296340 RepID=UPI00202E022F